MICRRLEEMTSFIVMDILERAQEMERAGESVIHLEVGEPDFNTPVGRETLGDRGPVQGRYSLYTQPRDPRTSRSYL